LDPVQRARLADATRGAARVVALASPEEIFELLDDHVDPLDLLALGTQLPRTEGIIRRVRSVRPQLPIVVFLGPSTSEFSTIPSLTEAGVHEIIIRGYNDQGAALLAAITTARNGCTTRWVVSRLAKTIPARLARFAEAILSDPAEITSVPALAARVGVHRKTLYNWCQLARFYKPAELLVWCRLALVAYYLETTRCSVDTIARDLGFPSDTALRNTLKRYTRLTATELRERGGLECLLKILQSKLDAHRAHLADL